MVTPDSLPTLDSIAEHYDEMDNIYRDIWGEHVHHGYWEDGDETVEEATRKLSELIVKPANIQSGDNVCDVGCGYGGTTRIMADEYEARVTAFTLSKAQYDFGVNHAHTPLYRPEYRQEDWFANDIAENSQDVVISIECLEHIFDKKAFFKECLRVLKPGGRLSLSGWLVGDNPSWLEQKLLLEPICRESHLPAIYSLSEYAEFIQEAGFMAVKAEAHPGEVRRTWAICIKRILNAFFTNKEHRAYMLNPNNPNRSFLITLNRMLIGYYTGAVSYGVFFGVKP